MRCQTCFSDLPLEAFYASNKSRCKTCVCAAVAAHRQANLERVRGYDRMRGSMPHRIAARAEYQKTTAGRAAHQRALKASALRHPERAKARTALGNAVRRGKVIPWPVCAVPACTCAPEGHHPDYAAPLEVVWLCNEHHREAHEVA